MKLAKCGPLSLKGKVEVYLGDLIVRVRDELLKQATVAIDDYQKRERKEWLFDHVAQLCIVCTQLFWTQETEDAFDRMGKGEPNALKEYSTKQIKDLSDLITLVQGELDKLQRRKVMNLITLETHSRDINLGLIADGFETKDCFKWLGQLKTRYYKADGDKEKDVWINICDATFRYSFEYLSLIHI